MARFGAGLRVYLNSMPLQWTRRRRQNEGHAPRRPQVTTMGVTELREAVSPTPQRTQARESKAETTARRKAEEESRKTEAAFAASTAVEVVVRAPGKRRATKAR